MAIQTELEYTSTGVDPIPQQYVSIAVGSPVLEYSHINVGTTPEPEPEPMSLASSPQQPITTQQTTTLEVPQSPSPDPPAVPLVETELSTAEVTFPRRIALFFLTCLIDSATKSLTHGNEFHAV